MKKKSMLLLASSLTLSAYSADISTDLYGFVLGSYQIQSNSALDSLRKPMSATDAVGAEGQQKQQFNFSRSRFGINAKSQKVSAKFEFDFDGAGNTNGVASGSELRIRQANLGYQVTDNGKFTFGKKWANFMGVLPHTYAVTTVNFKAGNTGFLIDGADYRHSFSKEFSVALEASDNKNEQSSPIMTANVDYKTEGFSVGVAGTMATIENVGGTEDIDSSGYKIYGSFSMIKNLDVRLEYYMGEGLAQIQTGDIGSGDQETSGYFISAKYAINDLGVFASYGATENDDALAGELESNTRTGLGIDYKLEEGLKAYIEYAMFDSEYVGSGSTDATHTEFGMMFKF